MSELKTMMSRLKRGRDGGEGQLDSGSARRDDEEVSAEKARLLRPDSSSDDDYARPERKAERSRVKRVLWREGRASLMVIPPRGMMGWYTRGEKRAGR